MFLLFQRFSISSVHRGRRALGRPWHWPRLSWTPSYIHSLTDVLESHDAHSSDPPAPRGPGAQTAFPTRPHPGVSSCVAFTSQNPEPPPLLGPAALRSAAALFHATDKQRQVSCSAFSEPAWGVSLTLGFILRTRLILSMVPFNAIGRYYTEQIVCQLDSKCKLDRQQGQPLNLNSRASIVTALTSPEAT